MNEECEKYQVGPAHDAEPPLTTEDLIAQAHAHRQGIPYETGEQLPERLRALADLVPSGAAQGATRRRRAGRPHEVSSDTRN